MKSRASRSKGDSRKTSRQESSKGSSANSSASTSSNYSYSGSLHRPGSMTDNVSHTLQRKINREASSDRQSPIDLANSMIQQASAKNVLQEQLEKLSAEANLETQARMLETQLETQARMKEAGEKRGRKN